MTVTAARPRATFAAWRARIFVSTWLAYAGFYFCRKAFYVVKVDLERELGLDAAALGDIGFAYLVAYTLGQFVSAGLGPRTGPRVLLLTGMAGSVVANVGFGVADSYGALLGFMVLNGFAQATGWPSCIGTLAFWTKRSERGWLLGLWSTCYQLGGVLANAWAAFWLAQQGFRGAFSAASAVLVVVWIVVLLFQRDKPEDVGLPAVRDDVPLAAQKTSDTEPDLADASPANTAEDDGFTRAVVVNVLLLGAFYFGVKFIRYALWSWTPYFLQKSYGLDGPSAGYLSTVFDVAGFLGVITAGFLSDKLFHSRRAKLAFLMLLGMLAGTAALYTVGSLGVVWFAACLAVVGFMLYGPDALLTGAGAIDVGSRRVAITAAGIINGMGSIGSIVQETVVSRVWQGSEGSMTPVFAMLFGASLLSVGALAVVLWRNSVGSSDL